MRVTAPEPGVMLFGVAVMDDLGNLDTLVGELRRGSDEIMHMQMSMARDRSLSQCLNLDQQRNGSSHGDGHGHGHAVRGLMWCVVAAGLTLGGAKPASARSAADPVLPTTRPAPMSPPISAPMSARMSSPTVATAQTDVAAAGSKKADAPALAFNDATYFHRWSQKGQHEFTPRGDEDLAAWKDMMTINVHDQVRTGDDLADLAKGLLANYGKHGYVMRTLSKPRTDKSEAEHFAAAVLEGKNLLEVAFARLLLHEGRGVIVVYSKRFYGDNATEEMKPWFKANAVKIERVLVSWNGIPSLGVLKALPAAPE